MKIFKNNKVYVQKNDVMFVFNHSEKIPAVIINKFFGGVVFFDSSNRMDFVSFDEQAAIDYFKGLDYILDYDDYKNLSFKELDEKAEIVKNKIDNIANRYNSLNGKTRAKNQDLVDEYEKLEYFICYLGEMIGIKAGITTIDIPSDEDEITLLSNNVVLFNKIDKSKKKGLKTFFKTKK